MIPLENIFDDNDVFKKSMSKTPDEEVEECNIRTTENVRNIKLSSTWPLNAKVKYLNLLKKYKYVFSWSYSELKTYDTTLIKHNIPLKLDVKPF